MTSAAYFFLPWARQGVLAGLSTPDPLDDTLPTRANLPVELRLTGSKPGASAVTNPIKMPLRLYGPGDVIGIDPREIVRTDPRHLTPDFPPHLMATCEFDRPDFPWLFTPARANSDKLRPWIVLVVVKKSKATLTADAHRPLSVLKCPTSELPDLTESWLWAHAQFVGPSDEGNMNAALAAYPQQNVSRLVCPRRLEPSGGTDTGYLACLVPAFDIGRKAGLGEAIAEGDEQTLKRAWDSAVPGDVELPVYYSWEFATAATAGDFEDLVDRLRLCRPSQAAQSSAEEVCELPEPAVMDVSEPGGNLPKMPGATLGVLSALQVPGVPNPGWPKTVQPTFDVFQQRLQTVLEAPPGAGGRVPPPIYGARQVYGGAIPSNPLGPAAPLWMRELNRDPRYRIAAALGAQVVQQQQEQMVAAAWRQAGEVADANRWLQQKQLAREVSRSVYENRLKALTPGSFQQVTAPVVAPRVASSSRTATMLAQPASPPSSLLEAVVSAPFRRIARPQGPLARRAIPIAETEQPVAGLRAALGPLLSSLAEAPASFDVDETPGRVAARLITAHSLAPDERTGVMRAPAAMASSALLTQLDPTITYAREARARIQPAPEAIVSTEGPEALAPLRLTPTFPQPMYEPLRDLFRDMLFPGLDALPNNAVLLLGPEPAFIEAFMVGLNDELGRELLWREFPTDLRGTYFRQFWDVRGQLDPQPTDADRERLRDIPPIADWRAALGWNMKPERGRDLVFLLIKGDLLLRFPTTVIFAARARWSQVSGSAAAPAVVDDSQNPVLPSLQVDVAPGVRMLGFNIPGGIAAAVGGASPPAAPGWFFVIQEHPTEPRFGLNVSRVDPLSTWRKLAWSDVAMRANGGSYIGASDKAPTLTGTPTQQDAKAVWGRTSADMAYIALQKAYRLEMHAGHWLA
jgi:hypothetical protein